MIKIIVQIGRKRKQGGHVAVLTAWHNDEEIKFGQGGEYSTGLGKNMELLVSCRT